MPKPSPEVLRDILRYDPETGKLFWRERDPKYCASPKRCARWNRDHAGKEALTSTDAGYRVGTIFNRHFKAHSVAWAIYHGRWPERQLDHINGMRGDNRIANLREVSYTENRRNAALYRRNKSGVCGVFFFAPHKRWIVNISGKYIGSFTEFDEAVDARRKAEESYGYHPNHGRPNLMLKEQER